MISLILPSLLAGLCIAAASGSLGCFVVWRRIAFFSDALAHSAVLGTALAVLAEIDPLWGLLGYGLIVAIIMASHDKTLHHSGDTLLAIIAQVSLALGLVLLPFAPQAINIEGILFGDILTVSMNETYLSAAISLGIIACLAIFWRPLIDLSIDEELAATEGVPVFKMKLLLFSLLVALIAIAVKMVGVLLISALLLIPAAAARRFVHTPTAMVFLAPCFGMLSVCAGLSAAFFLNTAAGPSIVIAAAALWLLSLCKSTNA